MATTKEKPIAIGVHRCAGGPKSLIDEHEPIGLSMRKCESIFVSSRAGAYSERCFHARGHAAAPKQLIVGAPLIGDELLQLVRPQHPAQHLKETDQVGLARAVCANENGCCGQVVDLNICEGPETLDANGLQCRIPHDAFGIRRITIRLVDGGIRHGVTSGCGEPRSCLAWHARRERSRRRPTRPANRYEGTPIVQGNHTPTIEHDHTGKQPQQWVLRCEPKGAVREYCCQDRPQQCRSAAYCSA